MMLPHPEEFLTACQFEFIELDKALGDELFVALHLIMKSCKDYMTHLAVYHQEQEFALSDRSLWLLSELKMSKLDTYDVVPTPEEIRAILAKCVTANVGYAAHFLANLEVPNEKEVSGERDNRMFLKTIRELPERYKGKKLADKLRTFLNMPASSVGACNSFHNDPLLMKIAMRQFGIALLVIKDDPRTQEKWPYETPDYLDELGSRHFLPLTFGLLHLPEGGHISILRKRYRTTAGFPEGEPCYAGFSLDMKTDIRTQTTNLMTGLFDLGYTGFWKFIIGKKKGSAKNLRTPRDYRDVSYADLVKMRVHWDAYQDRIHDEARQKFQTNQKEEQRRAQPSVATGRHPPGKAPQPADNPHETCGRARKPEAPEKAAPKKAAPKKAASQPAAPAPAQRSWDMDVNDMDMKAENNLDSYVGKTDEKKYIAREWYHDTYMRAWPSVPEDEDMCGKKMMIAQSLRLLGKTIATKDQMTAFFTDTERAGIIKERSRWYRKVGKMFHPDGFNRWVANVDMRKANSERFSALTTAVKTLVEWHDIAMSPDKSRREDGGENLKQWENELLVMQRGTYMSYDQFKQPIAEPDPEADPEPDGPQRNKRQKT
jgi:hypothetical protein